MTAAQAIKPVQPSRFANVTDAMLADAYGTASAAEKIAEAEKDALKSEFIRRKLWSAAGDAFVVTRSEIPQERLDTTKIRVEMGEDWCKARSRSTLAVSLRASRKDPAEPALALPVKKARRPSRAKQAVAA